MMIGPLTEECWLHHSSSHVSGLFFYSCDLERFEETKCDTEIVMINVVLKTTDGCLIFRSESTLRASTCEIPGSRGGCTLESLDRSRRDPRVSQEQRLAPTLLPAAIPSLHVPRHRSETWLNGRHGGDS